LAHKNQYGPSQHKENGSIPLRRSPPRRHPLPIHHGRSPPESRAATGFPHADAAEEAPSADVVTLHIRPSGVFHITRQRSHPLCQSSVCSGDGGDFHIYQFDEQRK